MDVPPLFKQGASARVRAGFFALISILMLLVDSRMHTLVTVRQAVGAGLYPFQAIALMPRDALHELGGYFNSLSALQTENDALRRQQATTAQLLQQERLTTAENARLRNLLNMQQRIPGKSIVGEILYDARDPFTRKIILNRGSQQGVTPGQPVIDDIGVVGQVTRVFPLTAEVTLLTDKDQAIPVQVLRSGLRSVVYGRGQSGVLELRFMAANADIQKGDALVTSGIDGVYPPGLSVARVLQVETKSADAFAHIVCLPSAGIDRNKQLLILLVEPNPPPRPDAEGAPEKGNRFLKRRLRDGGKDGVKDNTRAGDPVPARSVPSKDRKGPTPTAAPTVPAAATPAADAATAQTAGSAP